MKSWSPQKGLAGARLTRGAAVHKQKTSNHQTSQPQTKGILNQVSTLPQKTPIKSSLCPGTYDQFHTSSLWEVKKNDDERGGVVFPAGKKGNTFWFLIFLSGKTHGSPKKRLKVNLRGKSNKEKCRLQKPPLEVRIRKQHETIQSPQTPASET